MSADRYEKVFGAVIDAMENGVAPWRQPWVANGLPRNMATGRLYSGGNVVALWATAMVRQYSAPLWATYNQIKEAGGQVKAGEKSTAIYFMSRFTKDVENRKGETVAKSIPFLRVFNVFNAAQASGVDSLVEKFSRKGGWDGNGDRGADDMVTRTGAVIVHAGDAASYNRGTDIVTMPARVQFETVGGYYSTLFHELTHWTGHAKRLDREGGRFGSPEYAREELVAELGAAFLSSNFGWESVSQSAAYLKGWAKAARQDPKLLARAAADAQRAMNLITGTGEGEPVPDVEN